MSMSGDGEREKGGETAVRTGPLRARISNAGQDAAKIPEAEEGSSLATAVETIRQTAESVRGKPQEREKIINDGALDPAILTLVLAHLTKVYPMAPTKQIVEQAKSPGRRAWSRVRGAWQTGRATGTTMAALGSAPTVAPILSETMNIASRAVGMPKGEFFYATVVSLGFLAAAVAGPAWRPFSPSGQNVEQRRKAGEVLLKVFGDAQGLKNMRTHAADGNLTQLLHACDLQVKEFANLPSKGVQMASRMGWIAGMLGAGTVLASVLATSVESRSNAIASIGRGATLFPGVLGAELRTQPEAVQQRAVKIFGDTFSPRRGAESIGGFVTDFGRNAGILVGAIDPKRIPAKTPEPKR